jgi:hypothetical protein
MGKKASDNRYRRIRSGFQSRSGSVKYHNGAFLGRGPPFFYVIVKTLQKLYCTLNMIHRGK